MRKNMLRDGQAGLFALDGRSVMKASLEVARVEALGKEYVENEPDFVLRVMSNEALTRCMMDMENRTSQQLKRINQLEARVYGFSLKEC